jgi:pSer/pThr/pTyr-binding forkhead associated (FHA) protein
MARERARNRDAGGDGSKGRPYVSVCVESGFYAGLEWPIGQEGLVIGRGRKADLTLGEPTISRTHVRLDRKGRGLYLEDLGSTNGTQVNGERVSRAELRNGDELRMGKLALRVNLTGERDA